MAERQQQQEAWAPGRHLSPNPPSEGVDVHIVEPRMSQAPTTLDRDDQRDDMGSDTVSNGKATTDPVWTCESIRDAHEFIQEVNGRQYNAHNSVYSLPADKIEYARLAKQHTRHCVVLGDELNPHPAMVENVLRLEVGVEKKVLDIGCGSGIWTLSMASKFPHVRFIGIDLAPAILNEHATPENCRFELGDVNRGFPRFHGQIDLIHMRHVSGGITNYAVTVGEVIKCLKPGGMLILIEGDFEVNKEDQTHISPPADPNHPDASEPEKTWTARFGLEAGRAQAARGSDCLRGTQRTSQGLWDHPSMDPDSCGVIAGFSPIGPWPESANPEEQQRLRSLGTLEAQNIRESCGGVKKVLLENGIPERVLEHWLHMAELECQSNEVGNIWVIALYAWGRKLLADGTSAPCIPVRGLPYRPIPPHLGGQTPPHDPFGPYGKYPLAHYYPTAERARQWMEWRATERARLGLEPRPDLIPFSSLSN